MAVFLFASVAVPAANFYSIASITGSTTADPGDYWSLDNLIQGAGSGFSANAPHNSLGAGSSSYSWTTGQPNGSHGDYYANGQPFPVLVIDLGADRSLSEISTWGYNENNANGAKDFTLRFATAADGTNGFGTSITLNPSFEAAFATGPRDSHPFTNVVTARYVEMTITDNWRGFQGSTGGGDRVGLGEIAFEGASSDTDTDGDGLPDTWEINYGLDPSDDGSINPDNGADGDPDGDALPNRDEYFLESSPTDPADPDGRDWHLRPGKAHIMVVHAHPDDEGIFFGGLLPYVTQVRRLNTVLVTMNSDAPGKNPKPREREMRNAAWKYGLRSHPVFGRFRGHGDLHGGIIPLNNAWDTWDGDITDGVADKNSNGIPDGREIGALFVAEQIRRYRPDVIATHDRRGEYGHGAHKATSIVCADAFTLAADASVDIAGLPPWQAKKLYIHMHGKTNGSAEPDPSSGARKFFHDFWQEVTIDTTGNGTPDKTPIQIANLALDFHVSQGRPNVSTCYANGETGGGFQPHPGEWWELKASVVGDDTIAPDFTAPNSANVPITYSGWAKGDFFEHLTVFPDSDCDGLPDDWELDHFATLAAADPAGDDDGDGRDNKYEFVAGLNPEIPDHIDLEIDEDIKSVNFTVPAASGPGYEGLKRRYQLIFSPDLVDWSEIVTEGVANGVPFVYPIPSGHSRGFYRLILSIE